MAKVRIMTDGAGKEIIAELENSVKTLNGEEVNEINSEDYGSKNMVLESTGREIAESIGKVNEALSNAFAEEDDIKQLFTDYDGEMPDIVFGEFADDSDIEDLFKD